MRAPRHTWSCGAQGIQGEHAYPTAQDPLFPRLPVGSESRRGSNGTYDLTTLREAVSLAVRLSVYHGLLMLAKFLGGDNLTTVSRLMGHSKISMTARYAHSLDDAKIAVVSKLDFADVCSSRDPNWTPVPISIEAGSGGKILPASMMGL